MARKKPEAAKKAPEKQLSALEKRFASFKPARTVLEVIRAVLTVFPQFDYIARVGGWPIQRVGLVHGPSNEGKTQFCLGIAKSFLRRGHFVLWGDAERTTTITWVRDILGDDADNPRFFATKPKSYEAFVDEVRDFCRTIAAAREAGEVPPETTGVVIVDSIRKLVPEDIFKRIAKEGAEGEKGSVDGMGGRAAQIKAAMNAAWMDELVPLLDETRCACVIIARETQDGEADKWTKLAGNDFKIGGGKALFYDSALAVRIERDGWIVLEDEVDGKKVKRTVGERHSVTIKKTKIAGKQDKVVRGFFHTFLETGTFDHARDVVELGLRLGVLKMAGNRVRWESRGGSFAGREAAIAALGQESAADDLETLEHECRQRFDVEPEAVTAPEEEAPAASPGYQGSGS